MIIRLKKITAALVSASLMITPASANVGESMDRFMDDMGGAANITGPSAFEGQSAGYYSLGNVWTRFPQKTTNIANLQLPLGQSRLRRHRYLCGQLFFHQCERDCRDAESGCQ